MFLSLCLIPNRFIRLVARPNNFHVVLAQLVFHGVNYTTVIKEYERAFWSKMISS